MKFQPLTLLVFLTILVSCGDDVGGTNRKNPAIERSNPGLGNEDSGLISSHMHRSRGTTILSVTEEISQTIGNKLPTGYRSIPLIELDDEGLPGKNVLTVNSYGRPTEICGEGTNFTGISGRIRDCLAKNPKLAVWNGTVSGAAGETTWQLVTLTSGGKEFWQDLRTGLVWSDNTGLKNWCAASGNKQPSAVGIDIDCSTLGENQNSCAELGVFGTNIVWRLPTRNDFLQADINGARFVFKTSTTSNGYWTATVVGTSAGRSKAWSYNYVDGTLAASEMTNTLQVRCVGAPVN